MKTQVCIIGGGPSGLLLSQLLHLKGIDTVLLERHSREYVLARIRAGVLEHGFAALMREAQCGERMDREGEIHDGFLISDQGALQRVDLHQYSGGSSVVVYGQTELTRDLYDARDRMKGVVIHNAEDVQPHDLKSDKPYVTYRAGDETVRIDWSIRSRRSNSVSSSSNLPASSLLNSRMSSTTAWSAAPQSRAVSR